MAESLKHYIRTVEEMIQRERVLHEVSAELKAPVPIVRKAIRARALATLPKRGGLNKWAAAIKVKANQEIRGTTIHVKLKGGRNSEGGRSDIKRLDSGATRHPAWGRRGKGQWSVTKVKAGYFTQPATESDEWSKAADRGLDRALGVIR